MFEIKDFQRFELETVLINQKKYSLAFGGRNVPFTRHAGRLCATFRPIVKLQPGVKLHSRETNSLNRRKNIPRK